MSFLANVNYVDAIERLGGWAVVVWIVWWLTRRWEIHMGEMVKSLNKHREENKSEHMEIKAMIDKIGKAG